MRACLALTAHVRQLVAWSLCLVVVFGLLLWKATEASTFCLGPRSASRHFPCVHHRFSGSRQGSCYNDWLPGGEYSCVVHTQLLAISPSARRPAKYPPTVPLPTAPLLYVPASWRALAVAFNKVRVSASTPQRTAPSNSYALPSRHFLPFPFLHTLPHPRLFFPFPPLRSWCLERRKGFWNLRGCTTAYSPAILLSATFAHLVAAESIASWKPQPHHGLSA